MPRVQAGRRNSPVSSRERAVGGRLVLQRSTSVWPSPSDGTPPSTSMSLLVKTGEACGVI